MRRLRKLGAAMVCLALLAALTGCGRRTDSKESEELSVYASFYPIYAVAAMITEDVPDLRLNCLVQPQDGCLRSYVLSDWDMALLTSADALIIGGRGLESFEATLQIWEEKPFALAEALYNVELVERAADNSDPDSETHWLDANPHIYMSIDGAIEIAGRIAQSMAVLDPRYADLYLENLDRAEAMLVELKEEISEETAALSGKRAAVLNEALIYAARDYELEAALCWDRDSGESMVETELESLLAALQENDIQVVLIEKQAPQSLLEALEGSDVAVAALDVLSTRRADEGYAAYFAAQRANAAAVREAYLSISEEDV